MGQLRNGMKTALVLHKGHKTIIHTPEMKMPFKLDANTENTSRYAMCLNVPVDDFLVVRWVRSIVSSRPWLDRKIGHGGCTWNSVPRATTVTDFRFFFFWKSNFHSKILYVFRWTSWVNITGAHSKSSKILENSESWDRKFPRATTNIATWARRSMPVSRRTRAEHYKPIFNVRKLIGGVGFKPNHAFVVANLTLSIITVQTDQLGDFSNVHNFVKNFVWDPIQSTYCSELRGASFAPKKVIKRSNKQSRSWYILFVVDLLYHCANSNCATSDL
jgi:hypothetical protein